MNDCKVNWYFLEILNFLYDEVKVKVCYMIELRKYIGKPVGQKSMSEIVDVFKTKIYWYQQFTILEDEKYFSFSNSNLS